MLHRGLITQAFASALTLAAFAAAPSLVNANTAQTTEGRKIFQQKCAACHAIIPGRPSPLGPNLAGLGSRTRAASPGFAYSSALQKIPGKWDRSSLGQYLADPMKYAPGTRMAIAVKDERERQLVVEYVLAL